MLVDLDTTCHAHHWPETVRIRASSIQGRTQAVAAAQADGDGNGNVTTILIPTIVAAAVAAAETETTAEKPQKFAPVVAAEAAERAIILGTTAIKLDNHGPPLKLALVELQWWCSDDDNDDDDDGRR